MQAGAGRVSKRRVEVKRYRGGFKIEVNSAPFDAMISVIGKYPEMHGAVGLFTQTLASRGAYNEFGAYNHRTKKMNPSRPWMRTALRKNEKKYFNYLEQITKGLHGTSVRPANVRIVKGIMKTLMQEVTDDFQKSIRSGIPPANAPFTTLRKTTAGKATGTLREDMDMHNAVQWRWSKKTRKGGK